MKKKYAPKDLKRLNDDPEFQARVDQDKPLDETFQARAAERATEDMETALTLDGEIRVGDVVFPAPVTALLAFLAVIDSPYVSEDPGALASLTQIDVERALFVLKYRENAVLDLYEVSRTRRALDRLEDKVLDNAEALSVYLTFCERNASAWKRFDAAVAKFALSLGCYSPAEASAAISHALETANGGFGMIPKKDEDSKKKTASTPGG